MDKKNEITSDILKGQIIFSNDLVEKIGNNINNSEYNYIMAIKNNIKTFKDTVNSIKLKN